MIRITNVALTLTSMVLNRYGIDFVGRRYAEPKFPDGWGFKVPSDVGLESRSQTF